MKKHIFLLPLLALLLITANSSAQIKPKSQDWLAYDLSYGILINGSAGLEQAGVSNSHALTFTFDKPLSKRFSIAYGVGFHSDNFYSNLQALTNPATGDEDFQLFNYDTISSNKLTAQYFHIPFEVRFRGKPSDKGRFARVYLGARAGVRVNSYSNYVTNKIDVSYNNIGALNRFDYGVYTRIGYHYFSLYAYYGLSPLFDNGTVNDNAGNTYNLDQIRTLKIGISFSL